MTALDNYFKVQLIISERYPFNLSQKNNRESIDIYVTCPRKLVSSCKLGTITDKLIWEKSVIGPERRNTTWSVLGTFDDPADQLHTYNLIFCLMKCTCTFKNHQPVSTTKFLNYRWDSPSYGNERPGSVCLNKPMAWYSYKSLCQEVKPKIDLAKKKLLA